jgi:hypothetical protein
MDIKLMTWPVAVLESLVPRAIGWSIRAGPALRLSRLRRVRMLSGTSMNINDIASSIGNTLVLWRHQARHAIGLRNRVTWRARSSGTNMNINDNASSIGIHSYSGPCPKLQHPPGADRTGGMVEAARARTARFMYERMFEYIRYEWKTKLSA